jgi:hypothetical protein
MYVPLRRKTFFSQEGGKIGRKRKGLIFNPSRLSDFLSSALGSLGEE